MLSVIICPRSAQESLDQYRLLFENSIDNGSVSFCFWDENGSDISSVLPELEGITKGHKHWRAIIALPLCQESIAESEKTQPGNPFDYLENSNPFPAVEKSSVPLIHLTQLLGGIPALSESLIEQKAAMDGHSGDSEYILHQKEEQQRQLLKISDLYQMKSVRPDEIWILKAAAEADLMSAQIESKYEEVLFDSDSSLFWIRNRYPARCRYFTINSSLPNTALYYEDLFRFWLTVLSLAVNKFPAGTFDAYKVYRTESLIDFDEVKAYFSHYCNRLSSVLRLVNDELEQLHDITELDDIDSVMTMLQKRIEVKTDLSKIKGVENLYIDGSRLTLVGDLPKQELPWWKENIVKSLKALRKTYHKVRQSLDKGSSAARHSAVVGHPEIYPLNTYQLDEIKEEMTDLEKTVMSFGGIYAMKMKRIYYNLRVRDRKVEDTMRKRLYSKKTIVTYFLAFTALILGVIPFIVYTVANHIYFDSAMWTVFWIFLGSLIFTFAALFAYRQKLLSRIYSYNREMNWAIERLEESERKATEYLTNCTTLLRGNYLIEYYELRNDIHSVQEENLFRHSVALETRLRNIHDWMQDLNVILEPEDYSFKYPIFDIEIPPERNQAYLLDEDTLDHTMPLPNGAHIEAPYPFLKGFDFRRLTAYEPKRVSQVIEEMDGGDENE